MIISPSGFAGQPRAPDQACTDLHDDAEQPPGTDHEFPHALRDIVEHDGLDRRERGHGGKEGTGRAEQLDRIHPRTGALDRAIHVGLTHPRNIDP